LKKLIRNALISQPGLHFNQKKKAKLCNFGAGEICGEKSGSTQISFSIIL
jgi:hypothetical protein